MLPIHGWEPRTDEMGKTDDDVVLYVFVLTMRDLTRSHNLVHHCPLHHNKYLDALHPLFEVEPQGCLKLTFDQSLKLVVSGHP